MTVSRSDINDAVAGYIDEMVDATANLLDERVLDQFVIEGRLGIGPGDIPKSALLSMRRDVENFLKLNERIIRSSSWMVPGNRPVLEVIGWFGVGRDFATVRNRDDTRFREFGWRPDELTEKLDKAAWAFPKTELYVGAPEHGEEPGRLYFYTER